jgi:hypothetical protein
MEEDPVIQLTDARGSGPRLTSLVMMMTMTTTALPQATRRPTAKINLRMTA